MQITRIGTQMHRLTCMPQSVLVLFPLSQKLPQLTPPCVSAGLRASAHAGEITSPSTCSCSCVSCSSPTLCLASHSSNMNPEAAWSQRTLGKSPTLRGACEGRSQSSPGTRTPEHASFPPDCARACVRPFLKPADPPCRHHMQNYFIAFSNITAMVQRYFLFAIWMHGRTAYTSL